MFLTWYGKDSQSCYAGLSDVVSGKAWEVRAEESVPESGRGDQQIEGEVFVGGGQAMSKRRCAPNHFTFSGSQDLEGVQSVGSSQQREGDHE